MEKVEIGNATLYRADCMEVIPTLGHVCAVVTDPPYGIGAAKGSHSNLKMEDESWDDKPISDEVLRLLLKTGNNQIIWGGNYYRMPPTRGFLFWDKHPMPPSYAAGEYAWTSINMNAAKWCGKVGYETPVKDRDHPTQKPVGLMAWCISKLPQETETILDPFMGSGTTGVAAMDQGKKFIGIEYSRKYFAIACRRIERAQDQGRLF